MPPLPYLRDARDVVTATDLIRRFGDAAAREASAAAGRSRDLGNVVHFCRWRQVERLIDVLSVDGCVGTLH
jgi:hypothetical protein